LPIYAGAPAGSRGPGLPIHRWRKMRPSGTHDAAEFLDALDLFGTIQPGKRADLLLVDGNPLDDVANVARRSGVMVRGVWLAEDELRSRLEDLAASYPPRRN